MKENIAIVSFLDSFDFPLREATRKQVWWHAQAMKANNSNVTIYIVGSKAENKMVDGIRIEFINLLNIILIKADRLYCITGSVQLSFPIFIFKKILRSKCVMTLTDGDMFGLTNTNLRRFIARLLPFMFGTIQVFSNYQRKRLGLSDVKLVAPYLPDIKPVVSVMGEKTLTPSVLYMGHISTIKGFDFIIPAITRLLNEDKRITFTIANNMIHVEDKYLKAIDKLKVLYPEQIIIKGIVNPIEELSKHWVYIYPFTTAYGTMSYPLSLYESLKCGTPFVACNVSANSEFFDSKYLIEPNEDDLYNRIKNFINERKDKEGLS